MSQSMHRVLPLACAAVLFAASQNSLAQVTVHMQTAQGSCDATSSGVLQLRQGSADMEIEGGQTTLTGTGCGLVGTGDFSGGVEAGAGATVGTPFQFKWYVSKPTADTHCYYSADRASTLASDWHTGEQACAGTACPTAGNKKLETVNFTATGTSYKYGIVCTNQGGLSQTGAFAVGNPVGPAPTFTGGLMVTPASSTVGSDFLVKWTVANATTCTGSAKLGGTVTSLAGWTGTLAPGAGAAGVTLKPTAAGTYELSLTCSNSASPPASATATGQFTADPAQVDACINPDMRLTRGNLAYWTYGSVSNADLTEWSQIFGRMKPTEAIKPWPGASLSIPQITWGDQNKYISAHFKVTGSESPNISGMLSHFSNNPGPNIDTTISKTCGDFANGAAAYCKTTNKPASSNIAAWKVPGVNANYCELPPGDYYLNIKLTDPSSAASHRDCSSAGGGVYKCTVTLQSSWP